MPRSPEREEIGFATYQNIQGGQQRLHLLCVFLNRLVYWRPGERVKEIMVRISAFAKFNSPRARHQRA